MVRNAEAEKHALIPTSRISYRTLDRKNVEIQQAWGFSRSLLTASRPSAANTPPFGVSLVIIHRQASFGRLIRGMLPFYLPLGFALLLIPYWPGLVLWLPRLIEGF